MLSSIMTRFYFLPILVSLALTNVVCKVTAFQANNIQPRFSSNLQRRIKTTNLYAKSRKNGGSSGGGFGVKSSKASPVKISKKDLAKKIAQKYGGTTPQEIARGTQLAIEQAMQKLEPHLQMAIQLQQHIVKWDAYVESLSLLQKAQLSSNELEGAKRAKTELERLYTDHGFDETDLRNTLQRITWDASADAKAARSVTGDMPANIRATVKQACEYIAEAVANNNVNDSKNNKGRCLDVGCGYGAIIPILLECGIDKSQITGVDLSAEMIRNAKELHPGVNFVASDFIKDYDDKDKFDGIVFCSSLHDMPDILAALKKASSLLRKNGVLVVVHPQGAAHVDNQVRANPVLVKRGLPTALEWKSFDMGLSPVILPESSIKTATSTDGYLAVLKKIE